MAKVRTLSSLTWCSGVFVLCVVIFIVIDGAFTVGTAGIVASCFAHAIVFVDVPIAVILISIPDGAGFVVTFLAGSIHGLFYFQCFMEIRR